MLKNKFPLDLQKVSKKYADAYLTTKEAADDEVLSVHRVLMATLSPKLRELFGENESEKRIVVRNVRFDVLSAIVNFVYSGQIDVEHKGAEFIEDFMDGLNMLKIEIGEKACGKLGEELKKTKEAEKLRKTKAMEDSKELRELEKKLEMLRKQNDLAEMGRKRSRSDDVSDENLNQKKPMAGDMSADRASKTKDTSGSGMKTSPNSRSKPDSSKRGERRRCNEETMVKQERQESWEPSDVEESCDIRTTLHEKQKKEAHANKRGSSSSKRSVSKMKSFSTWESAAGNLAASRLRSESREMRDKSRDMAALSGWESAAAMLRTEPYSKERRSYEHKSRGGGRDSRSDYGNCKERNVWEKRGKEDGERGHNRWLSWNFDPRRSPEPDPNWPQQLQVIIIGFEYGIERL